MKERVSWSERKVTGVFLKLVLCFVTPCETWIQHDLGSGFAYLKERESHRLIEEAEGLHLWALVKQRWVKLGSSNGRVAC